MSTAFRVLVEPDHEPISLATAKAYLRVDFDEPGNDALIVRLITTAREEAEHYTHLAVVTQTIECIQTIERPSGGELSGPIQRGPNWYQYQEQLGANPFGAAMFYFDLPMPPCQEIKKIETRTTVWDAWQEFHGLVTLDAVPEPARLYFQVPVTANQWRFQYVAGYSDARSIPHEISQAMYAMVNFWYNSREGEKLPDGIYDLLIGHRVDWV